MQGEKRYEAGKSILLVRNQGREGKGERRVLWYTMISFFRMGSRSIGLD